MPHDRAGHGSDSGGRTVSTDPGDRPAVPLAREARLRDPAHRDQDGPSWHAGRFAERVRRQWNAVDVPAAPPADLEALARHVQARVGGDLDAIRHRLEEFAALERAGPPAGDPLVRPGEPV